MHYRSEVMLLGGGGVALLWHVSLQYKALEGTVVVI